MDQNQHQAFRRALIDDLVYRCVSDCQNGFLYLSRSYNWVLILVVDNFTGDNVNVIINIKDWSRPIKQYSTQDRLKTFYDPKFNRLYLYSSDKNNLLSIDTASGNIVSDLSSIKY